MTAVTFLRHPDELLDQLWPDRFPGRAVDPTDTDIVTPLPRWRPQTPSETTAVCRQVWCKTPVSPPLEVL
jgi:hypothetical protein